MEFKGTPGPWISSSYGSQVLTGDSWNTICELKPSPAFEKEKVSGSVLRERQIFNSRLIAAAPELLKALDNLCKRYLANRGSKHEFVMCITPKGKMPEWVNAEEVIKKALDESKTVTNLSHVSYLNYLRNLKECLWEFLKMYECDDMNLELTKKSINIIQALEGQITEEQYEERSEDNYDFDCDSYLILEKPLPINTEVLAENYRSKNKDLERGRICRIETYWNNDGSFSKHSYSVRLVRKSNSGNPIILHVGSDKVTPILGEEGGSNE